MCNQIKVDLSIIVVNYNTKVLLRECIESIKTETQKISYEIIVSDNGSEDGSIDMIKNEYKDVVLIENRENLGFAKANNNGIKISRGRHICLMNSDIKVIERAVDRMVNYLDTHKDVGALAPLTIDGDGKTRYNCRKIPDLWNCFCDSFYISRVFKNCRILSGRSLPEDTYFYTHEAEVISGCFFMVPDRVLEEVGILDERFFFYAEDTDWCKRISDAGMRIVYKHDIKSIHYGGESSRVEPVKFSIQMHRADLQYWEKYNSGIKVFLYLLFSLCRRLILTGFYSVMTLVSLFDERKVLNLRNNAHAVWWLIFNRR